MEITEEISKGFGFSEESLQMKDRPMRARGGGNDPDQSTKGSGFPRRRTFPAVPFSG